MKNRKNLIKKTISNFTQITTAKIMSALKKNISIKTILKFMNNPLILPNMLSYLFTYLDILLIYHSFYFQVNEVPRTFRVY